MKKRMIKLAATIGLLAIIFGSANVWAEEEKPTASADVAVLSKYVWRGYELSKDSAVIQPSATIGYKGFGFNLWGNLDTDTYANDNMSNNWTETDWTLSYDKNYGMVGLGIGYIYYEVDGGNDAQELYLSVGFDTFLAPSVTVYRDISYTPQWYVSFGISHSFALPKDMSFDLAGSVAYNASDDDSFVEVDDNGNATTNKYSAFHDGLISVGLTIPVGEYFTIAPMVAYSFPLTNEAKNLIKSSSFNGEDSDFFFGGVTVSMSF